MLALACLFISGHRAAAQEMSIPLLRGPVTLDGAVVEEAWRYVSELPVMSQFMDRRVEGALGGSALRYLRIRLDYPGGTASFEPINSKDRH